MPALRRWLALRVWFDSLSQQLMEVSEQAVEPWVCMGYYSLNSINKHNERLVRTVYCAQKVSPARPVVWVYGCWGRGWGWGGREGGDMNRMCSVQTILLWYKLCCSFHSCILIKKIFTANFFFTLHRLVWCCGMHPLQHTWQSCKWSTWVRLHSLAAWLSSVCLSSLGDKYFVIKHYEHFFSNRFFLTCHSYWYYWSI